MEVELLYTLIKSGCIFMPVYQPEFSSNRTEVACFHWGTSLWSVVAGLPVSTVSQSSDPSTTLFD